MNPQENIIEICETDKPYIHKVRSETNRRKWYNVIQRRDETFWCNCPSFKYNGDKCKHILAIQAMIE